MKALDRFHQRRRRRLRQVQTLALRDRNRARIGAHRSDDRDADAVETGDVAEARNPHLQCKGAEAGEGLGGRNGSVGAAPKHLWQLRLGDGARNAESGWRQPFLSVAAL